MFYPATAFSKHQPILISYIYLIFKICVCTITCCSNKTDMCCIEFVGYCEMMLDSGGGGEGGMGWMLSDSDDTADHPNDPASPHCAQTFNIPYLLCLNICLYFSSWYNCSLFTQLLFLQHHRRRQTASAQALFNSSALRGVELLQEKLACK